MILLTGIRAHTVVDKLSNGFGISGFGGTVQRVAIPILKIWIGASL